MYIEVIVEILLACFAVFGFYAAFRTLLLPLFLPKECGAALFLTREVSAAELRVLLRTARNMSGVSREGKIVALVEENVIEREKLCALLRAYHIPYYIVAQEEQGKE